MDAGAVRSTRRPPRAFVPLLLAVAATVVLLVLPTGTEDAVSLGPDGRVVHDTRSTTLLRSQGWTVLVVLAIPVILAAMPPIPRGRERRRRAFVAAGALLCVFVGLSLPSVGLFYLPAAIAMVVGAVIEERGRRAPGGQAP
jgi:uncharacterized membrane protein YozB (DUF420 family)